MSEQSRQATRTPQGRSKATAWNAGGSEPGQAGGSNLLLQFTVIFGVVAFLLSLAAGFAVTSFLSSDIRNKTLDDLEAEVTETTVPRTSAIVSQTALNVPLSGDELVQLDAFVRGNVLDSRI